MECLFCKIVHGVIPAKRVFEDDQAIAFRDLHPQAPVHVLIVPKKHLGSLAGSDTAGEQALLGHLVLVAAQVSTAEKLKRGYRVVINTGEDGGQTVDHLHIHLLGGRAMEWPPG